MIKSCICVDVALLGCPETLVLDPAPPLKVMKNKLYAGPELYPFPILVLQWILKTFPALTLCLNL